MTRTFDQTYNKVAYLYLHGDQTIHLSIYIVCTYLRVFETFLCTLYTVMNDYVLICMQYIVSFEKNFTHK